jgi:hypothetical protein
LWVDPRHGPDFLPPTYEEDGDGDGIPDVLQEDDDGDWIPDFLQDGSLLALFPAGGVVCSFEWRPLASPVCVNQ